VGFEHTTPASERPQIHALDRAAIAVGRIIYIHCCFNSYEEFIHYLYMELVGRWSVKFSASTRDGNIIGKILFSLVGKGKTIPLQAWTGPEGSRRLRLPDLKSVGT